MGMPDVLVMPLRVRNVPPGRLVAYFGTKIDTLKQIAKQKKHQASMELNPLVGIVVIVRAGAVEWRGGGPCGRPSSPLSAVTIARLSKSHTNSKSPLP
jgi:hypothetical protein